MSTPLPDDIRCVAETAWGEARGCGSTGLQAVINVIYNRAAHPSWWGRDAVSVCCEPYQFSCRNLLDVNWPQIQSVTVADRMFAVAVSLATQAKAGKLADLTRGADSYYARSLRNPPSWATHATRTYVDQCHYFFRTATPPPTPNISLTAADLLNEHVLHQLRNP